MRKSCFAILLYKIHGVSFHLTNRAVQAGTAPAAKRGKLAPKLEWDPDIFMSIEWHTLVYKYIKYLRQHDCINRSFSMNSWDPFFTPNWSDRVLSLYGDAFNGEVSTPREFTSRQGGAGIHPAFFNIFNLIHHIRLCLGFFRNLNHVHCLTDGFGLGGQTNDAVDQHQNAQDQNQSEVNPWTEVMGSMVVPGIHLSILYMQ